MCAEALSENFGTWWLLVKYKINKFYHFPYQFIYISIFFFFVQTGSGKTYTMLGEIEDLEVKPSPHRGMTPRIFEFLFARIQAVTMPL